MKTNNPIKKEQAETISVAAAAISFVFLIPGEQLGCTVSANSSTAELNNSAAKTDAAQSKTTNHSTRVILRKTPRKTEKTPSIHITLKFGCRKAHLKPLKAN